MNEYSPLLPRRGDVVLIRTVPMSLAGLGGSPEGIMPTGVNAKDSSRNLLEGVCGDVTGDAGRVGGRSGDPGGEGVRGLTCIRKRREGWR